MFTHVCLAESKYNDGPHSDTVQTSCLLVTFRHSLNDREHLPPVGSFLFATHCLVCGSKTWTPNNLGHHKPMYVPF